MKRIRKGGIIVTAVCGGFGLSLIPLRGAGPHLPADVTPLPSSAPHGRGPLALVNLHHVVLGTAFVSGGKYPDLFVAGYGGPKAVHLFHWTDTDASGAPVFAKPKVVKCPFTGEGTVFQTKDGVVHGLWIAKSKLVHTLLDAKSLEFREVETLPLDKKIKSPSSIAALPNGDGSYDLTFEVSNGAESAKGDPWTEEWRPYNSSGIANGELRYRYLFGAHLPGLLRGPLTDVKQITATNREVYFVMNQLSGLNLGPGHERDLVTGSRQGNFTFYRNTAAQGWKLEPKRLIAGEDGNALRHPTINPSVLAYPSEDGTSNLIACGEGALYFYQFTGRFTEAGAPIYRDPVPVLQDEADLYAGTLPTPTVVDWNGDGVPDLLVGNSEGHILFFENIGTMDDPRFLPARRVQAGGREIHVEAGYAGSLQGLQEARWGYLSPNVVDWNGDGLPDIITGDITGNFMIYLNRGTAREPRLDPAHPLYCDGIDLHGKWRVRPAIAKINGRMTLVMLDGDDHLRQYWRIDDYNLEDGGILHLEDGRPIGASGGPGGMSGRCKLDFFDWNQDGALDLIVGTARINSVPDPEHGFPMPSVAKRTVGTPLLLLNTGSDAKMKFALPQPFHDITGEIVQPGGAHETGAIGTMLGGCGPNLLICNEAGRMFLIRNRQLQPPQASKG
ncbi:MAG TPA: VCBS repeat-containing protein [Verrucomicrobiaceae bacterium]